MTRTHALLALVLVGAVSLVGNATANAQPPAAAPQVPAVQAKRPTTFLSLDGIKGESQDTNHKDWIQVMSFSWGASSPRDTSGAGAAAGRQSHQSISITKVVDSTSPKLMQAVANGTHFKRAVLEIAPAGKQKYYQITLTDVLVSSRSLSSGGDRPQESVTLNFTKIEVKYTQQNSDGTAGGAYQPAPAGWDLEKDAK